MGQNADDIVDGTVCCLCGQFFEELHGDGKSCPTHGYPVVCWECWAELSKGERKQYQRALHPVLGTVELKARST